MIEYYMDHQSKQIIMDIVNRLNMTHIDPERVVCVTSRGTKSRNIIARCHVLPRIMQKALSVDSHYVIELVSEKYSKLSDEEKIKTLIHELLHIPKSFGGGFRHHDYVTRRTVDRLYDSVRGDIHV
ncbi:MAG: putative metallopeptidase [Candidatus Aenigmatarchaeota archaeon]